MRPLTSPSRILSLACNSLKSSIERLSALGEVEHDPEARKTFLEFRDQLTQGKIRAAEKIDVPGNPGRWTVNAWVKQGILLGFRLGELAEMNGRPVVRGQRHFPCPHSRRRSRARRARADRRYATAPTLPPR